MIFIKRNYLCKMKQRSQGSLKNQLVNNIKKTPREAERERSIVGDCTICTDLARLWGDSEPMLDDN